MIRFRNELPEDWSQIAKLHAVSWKRHYAGIYHSEYLENRVFDDRNEVWKKRFESKEAGRNISIVEINDQMAGFACTYLNRHQEWGALLDNLHVLQEYQGKGLGLALMQQTFDWVKKQDSQQNLYLGVLRDNYPAKKFYARVGGHKVGEFSEICPAGNEVVADWMLWTTRPAITFDIAAE
jgi:GNAT superfamily N-acetyltransferase